MLNPTERYRTLLEIWLVHATPEIIDENGAFGMNRVLID
jgi:hypothetical protein